MRSIGLVKHKAERETKGSERRRRRLEACKAGTGRRFESVTVGAEEEGYEVVKRVGGKVAG